MDGPIYNPKIPFLGLVPGGFMPGRVLRIQGSVPYNAKKLAINLQCGPSIEEDDIAFHIKFYFPRGPVVRNHLQPDTWGPEETAGANPLQPGAGFHILVLCEYSALKVAVNGVHFCQFNHRLPYQRISHVAVYEDVHIQTISFEGQPAPQPAGYMQPTTYINYGGGGPAPLYSQQPGMIQIQQQAPMMMAAPPVRKQEVTINMHQSNGMGTGAAVGLGVGSLAAGGLAGYALAGGFGSVHVHHSDHSDHAVHLVRPDHSAHLVRPDQSAHLVRSGSDHSVHSDHSAHSEHSVHSDHSEHSEHSDHSDHSEHSEHSDNSDHSEHSEHSDHSDHSEHSEHSDHSDHSFHSDYSIHSVHPDHSIHSDHSVHSVHPDHSIHSDHSVHSDHSEHSEPGSIEEVPDDTDDFGGDDDDDWVE